MWPLSTPEVPKQFTPLFAGASLFSLTLHRLTGVPGLVDVIVVTGASHLDLVTRELEGSQVGARAIVVEPTGRNTAPAAVAAAMLCDPSDVMAILPADHLIVDDAAYRSALDSAVELAEQGHLVAFGIEPDRPETGFGYIETGGPIGAGHVVSRFEEKPDLETARAFSADGRHLWNSGMFVARADVFLEEARTHCPLLVEGVTRCMPEANRGLVELAPGFAEVESISIDYAIMERTERGVVVPMRAGWSDVGSYLALLHASERDSDGNHLSGDVTAVDTTGSYLKSTSRRVVVAGVHDLIVVETPDAVLVLPMERSQEVRDLQGEPGL